MPRPKGRVSWAHCKSRFSWGCRDSIFLSGSIATLSKDTSLLLRCTTPAASLHWTAIPVFGSKVSHLLPHLPLPKTQKSLQGPLTIALTSENPLYGPAKSGIINADKKTCRLGYFGSLGVRPVTRFARDLDDHFATFTSTSAW